MNPGKLITDSARLLYRISVYIASSDSRGMFANKSEHKALDKILRQYIKDTNTSDFIKNVAQEAIALNASNQLHQNLENVPLECEENIKSLEEFMSVSELETWKYTIMNVAQYISEANREIDKGEITPFDAFWGILIPFGRVFFTLSKFREIFLDVLRNKTFSKNLSFKYKRISYNEDQAIAKIAVALSKNLNHDPSRDSASILN